ncbi:MAG: lysophospholipid acyltransferase family protein [Christensenellaceae bacterium]|jgi:1-acyl-sn-glycerol-3-phosphate acyltransferase
MMYRIAAAIVRPIMYLFYRIRVIGKENAQQKGAYILAANHLSNIDPILTHIMVKPKIYYMAKEELFRFKPLAWLITWLGAFPVARGKGDRAAIRAALTILEEGKILAMFPEGHRNKTEAPFLPFQPGAVVIALRAKVPILPMCICAKPRLFRKTTIVIGQPMELSELLDENLSHGENVKKITKELECVMQTLRERGLQA